MSIGSGLAGFVSGAGSISPGLSLLGSSLPSSAYKKKKKKKREKVRNIICYKIIKFDRKGVWGSVPLISR